MPPFLEDGILVSQPSPLGEGLDGGGFAASIFSVQDDDTGEQLVARRGIFLQVHKKRASWKRYAFLCCGIADDLIMIASAFPVDYFPVSLFVLPVDVPKEE